MIIPFKTFSFRESDSRFSEGKYFQRLKEVGEEVIDGGEVSPFIDVEEID